VDAHAIDSRVDLFEVAYVRADSKGVASAMFNLKMSGVEFGFAASQKSNARAEFRKTDCEPLSDAAACSGYEYGFVFEVPVHSLSPHTR